MSKYDFFVAGRWRNREVVKQVVDAVRASGNTAYCFIENLYEGEKIEFSIKDGVEHAMQALESLPMEDSFVRKIFDADMTAQRESEAFILVLPAGISGHIEAGAAYGMGKKCYAVGQPDKTETLYLIFDEIFPDVAALTKKLQEDKSIASSLR